MPSVIFFYPSPVKETNKKKKKLKKKKRVQRYLKKGQKPYLDCYQRHAQGLVRDGVAALIRVFLAFVTSKTDSHCYFNIFIVCE